MPPATEDRPADVSPVIDFGAHFFPESVFPSEAYAAPIERGAGFIELLRDPAAFLRHTQGAGIDYSVLSQPTYLGISAIDEVRAANDALLDLVDAHEGFLGLAAIPVAAGGTEAAAEFERCLEAGYHGGAVETRTEGIGLSAGELTPVFEVAERADAPIFVHPTLHDSMAPEAFDERFALNAVFGREAALSEAICRVIHEGVLDRHPDLDLVFHHYGGNIAAMLGRLHNHLDPGRWPEYGDYVKPWGAFRAQFEERIYVDTAGYFGYHLPQRAVQSVLPISHIVFGTDFPFEPRTADELRAYRSAIEENTASTDARAILGGNALELLSGVDA